MRTGATGITCDQPATEPGKVVYQPVLRHSALELRPLPGAVPSARLHARVVLAEWDLGAVARDAELVVSELVTNACRAALADAAGGEPFPVRLRLTACPGPPGVPLAVQVEVWDVSGQVPRRQAGPLEEPGGRGLLIVDAVASRWGC